MVYGGFDLQNPEIFIRGDHFHFNPVGPVMEIQVFKKYNSIKHIELELQKDSQKHPTENPPEFLHKYFLANLKGLIVQNFNLENFIKLFNNKCNLF